MSVYTEKHRRWFWLMTELMLAVGIMYGCTPVSASESSINSSSDPTASTPMPLTKFTETPLFKNTQTSPPRFTRTPNCIPMTPDEWHKIHTEKADELLASFSWKLMAVGGPMDPFGTMQMQAYQDLYESDRERAQANDYSRLCNQKVLTVTPTP